MSKCRNPECKNGTTPGVVIVGKGTKDKPILGQSMKWGWVRCSVCNPQPKDPPFKLVKRTPEEIAQRAAWATERIEYKPKSIVASGLARVKAAAPTPTAAPAPANDDRLDKMLQRIDSLLEQLEEMRKENKELKEALAKAQKPEVAKSVASTAKLS